MSADILLETASSAEKCHQKEVGHTVITVVENRAREVCIAKIDNRMISCLQLFLLTDSHSYSETLSLLAEIGPDEILLHDTSKNKPLGKSIEKSVKNGDTKILYISRKYFDQDRGAEMLKKLVCGNVDADLIAKYTVLAGSYCLIRYVENLEGINLAANSIRVEYSAASGRMAIDRRTSINLEIVEGKGSLFTAINNTTTVVGARLLRASLLRPTTDKETIDTRLSVVEILLRSNKACTDITACLMKLPDLDKMLGTLTIIPKSATLKAARTSIDTLIAIKQTLLLSPMLAQVIRELLEYSTRGAATTTGGGSHDTQGGILLSAMSSSLLEPGLQWLRSLIDDSLTESTTYSKSPHEMRHQECFALRPGLHGLLDVARKTFLESVEDIHETAEAYSHELEAPVKVSFSASRGYHLLVPSSVHPLPPYFTQAVLNKKTISCSSEEISSLSQRAAEAIGNALTITHVLLGSLLGQVRDKMASLFAVADCVALADMLLSFTAYACQPSAQPKTRPIVTDTGPLVINAGAHPVLQDRNLQHTDSSFVPNDTYMDSLNNFQVITGPNGAGKSVYIKQCALIVILAQIGCFVPAAHAVVPIRNRILSRIGTSDDMEHNLSSFLTEMKEAAYIFQNLTDRSLVIIDELGRGTSNSDGLALAFATAEALLDSTAYTLFVTHFPQITLMSKMYTYASNKHLQIAIDTSTSSGGFSNGRGPYTSSASTKPLDAGAAAVEASGGRASITFLHKVGDGPCEIKSGYGILMSELCGFPSEMIQEARAIQKVVKNLFPVLLRGSTGGILGDDFVTAAACKALLQKLLLLRNSSLGEKSLRNYLQDIRADFMSKERVQERISSHLLQVRSRTRSGSATTSIASRSVVSSTSSSLSSLSLRRLPSSGYQRTTLVSIGNINTSTDALLPNSPSTRSTMTAVVERGQSSGTSNKRARTTAVENN